VLTDGGSIPPASTNEGSRQPAGNPTFESNSELGNLMCNAKLYQLVALAIVAGCTTQPGKDHGANNVNAAGSDVQCHSAPLTGSMLSKKVCTTKADRDAQQRWNDDIQNSLTRQPTAPTQTPK
jgi:hypothetical protein